MPNNFKRGGSWRTVGSKNQTARRGMMMIIHAKESIRQTEQRTARGDYLLAYNSIHSQGSSVRFDSLRTSSPESFK